MTVKRMWCVLSVGLLAVLCLAGGLASAGRPSPKSPRIFSFGIDAKQSTFTNTPITLAKLDTAEITVTGDGTCHAPSASDCPPGPDGAGNTCAHNPVAGPLPPGPAGPDVPYGAVAGRLGKGKAFFVGRGKTVHGPGRLSMIYNDCNGSLGYADNGGFFRVSIVATDSHDEIARIYDVKGHVYVRRGRRGNSSSCTPTTGSLPGT